jgi:hypothetical protein
VALVKTGQGDKLLGKSPPHVSHPPFDVESFDSAYGYLAAGGELTRFADVHAANEVTRHGRETLELMCRELAARGVTLLEADTDPSLGRIAR